MNGIIPHENIRDDDWICLQREQLPYAKALGCRLGQSSSVKIFGPPEVQAPSYYARRADYKLLMTLQLCNDGHRYCAYAYPATDTDIVEVPE